MQNRLLKFRQSSIISEKSDYLSEKVENFDELQLSYSLITFTDVLHKFPTDQCLQKGILYFNFFFFIIIIE